MIFKRKKKIWFLEIIFLINFCGYFTSSDGKICPEISRPHKTRCDKYFRCMTVQMNTYVWIPAQCSRGLIYEPSLKACVLPGENWECNLADDSDNVDVDDGKKTDEQNVYGVNNIPLGDYSDHTSGEEDMLSVGDSDSEPIIISDSDDGLDILNSEDNGDDGDLTSEMKSRNAYAEDELDNYSGDSEITIENKGSTDISIPSSDDVGNSLKSHLQRLSQLIDNMKNRHDNKTTGDMMHADELNTYLSSHNLLTTPPYQLNNYNSPNKLSMPTDGKLDPDFMNHIIQKQNSIGYDDVMRSTLEGMKSTTPMSPPSEKITNNSTLLFPLKSPNVKLHFKSESPLKGYRQPDYQSSHIIVNRPGGSVLFNVDSNNNNNDRIRERPNYSNSNRNEPYISEETLKTVLELSKQLIENQNVRHMFPQPVMKPIYYSIPIPIISKYYNQNSDDDKEQPTVEITQPESGQEINGFINNLPVRHKIIGTKGGSIPITVTNSFNTYKDYENKGQSYQTPVHGPQNNISTTVIFDRNYNYQKTEESVPQTLTTTQRIISTTVAPAAPLKENTFAGNSGNQKQQYDFYSNNQNTNYPSMYNQFQARPAAYNPMQNYYAQQVEAPSNSQNGGYPSYLGYGGYHQNPSVIYNNEPAAWGQYNPQQQTNQIYQPQNQKHQNYPAQQMFNGHSSSAQPTPTTYQNLPPQMQPINYNNQNTRPTYNFVQNQPNQPPSLPQNTMMNVDDVQVDNDGDDDNAADDGNMMMNENFENIQQKPIVMTSLTSTNKLDQNKLNTLLMKQKLQSSNLLSQINGGGFGGLLDPNEFTNSAAAAAADDQNKLVNIAGTFIGYDRYKNSLLPLLQSPGESDIEIVTCSSGVRQPNTTDCTKYYVCNPRNRNVLPYSCPPFTAFNKGTKICDAQTYAFCKPESIVNRYSIAENMKVHQEAQLALEEAKRIRLEAIRAQSVANMIRLQSQGLLLNDHRPPSSYQEIETIKTTTSLPPNVTIKRRIRCYDTGKISDPDSANDYWVCFRGKDNRMKRQKMTCSKGLVFCKSMRLCTVPTRCQT